MGNLAPTTTAEPCTGDPARPTLQALPGRLTDLGGLAIRRLLPRSQRRLVGPWLRGVQLWAALGSEDGLAGHASAEAITAHARKDG